ncbi:unnamed protein product [Closterium sp. Yama58-4]|nr:unnamed protein product [Closterium sp. Yama58-4]
MAAMAAGVAAKLPSALKTESILEASQFLGQPASTLAFPVSASSASRISRSTRCAAKADGSDGNNAAPHTHTKRAVSRRLILGGMAAGMAAVVGCPICDSGSPSMGAALAADWSYGELSGPNEWGAVCKTGAAQSPIDISFTAPKIVSDNSIGKLAFGYKRADATFLNTGHGTMQVNFPGGSNTCEIGGRKLELLQYHFHAPSEHSFNGIRTAMEAHLVHRDAEGKLAVVGVMLEADPKAPRNLCLEAALAFSPNEKLKQIAGPVECFEVPAVGGGKPLKQCLKIQISPEPLLPKPDRADGAHNYIHYKGSLTTPPCSEGVDWFVLSSPMRIPDAQVVEFMRYVGDRQTLALNSRPRQDLGDRFLVVGPA